MILELDCIVKVAFNLKMGKWVDGKMGKWVDG
jgi:hypothetical protein